MSSSSRTSLVLLILCLLVLLSWVGNERVTAKSTKVGDDLRLVEDSEEDEEWLRWGGELEEQQLGMERLGSEEELVTSIQLQYSCFTPHQLQQALDQARREIQQDLGQ